MDEKHKDKKELLSIGEASEYLGVSIDTLRRWEKKEKIIALRSPGGHRYFNKKDLDNLFGRKYEREKETLPRKVEKSKVEMPIENKQEIIEEAKPTHQPEEKPSVQTDILDRTPKKVDIPPVSPIRVIEKKPSTFSAQPDYMPPHPTTTAQGILTPPKVSSPPIPVSEPISSIPPVVKLSKESSTKKSRAWIFAALGFALLVIGFAIFIIFRAPTEVITPIP